jgi:hypothetical protein
MGSALEDSVGYGVVGGSPEGHEGAPSRWRTGVLSDGKGPDAAST